MRPEKQALTQEYLQRLQGSPYFIVVNYTGLNVAAMTELRRRLAKAQAELHVVKNTIFRIAAREAGLGDLGPRLTGQLAVVTGRQDICAAAKVLKTFAAEFDKPKLRFGYLGNQALEAAQIEQLAELPPLEVLRAQLLGVLQAPAARLARLLQTPAAQLARVLQARIDKEGGASAS
ncbi:50S ribosomal protein L10 [Limisphaera sp. VF-2]|jgi:large subunit ribosomal protein L10|uniref:50S ribosomal protein L10 n=1 Tax=Limisphaera sp. VF-2 TaxID=3400418 RepID=UPI00176B422C|nr:50S ribosomal protein L10 [Limisphaera sp.]